MPPPAIARIEAKLRAQRNGDTPPLSPSPKKVRKHVKKPEKGMKFSRFPAEIQQMIWAHVIQKPACHTFKILKPRRPITGPGSNAPWTIDLQAIPSHYDPSAYRQWKSMLWNRNYKLPPKTGDENREGKTERDKKGKSKTGEEKKRSRFEEPRLDERDLVKADNEKANLEGSNKPITQKSHEAFSKLANISFQTGFQNAMIKFQPIVLKTPNIYRRGAAIDVATDLVIIEFERGETAAASAWFEHSTPRMQINGIRHLMQDFKRVAVHYKKTHSAASDRGPFQCYCPAAARMGCFDYKACPMEQACFLDCFPNLEEFYYVMDVRLKREMTWFDQYKNHARQRGYELRTSDGPKSAPFQLAHFSDMQKEYLQLCPKKFFEFLPLKLRDKPVVPLKAMDEPRDCLVKVMQIYKGHQGNEVFINPVDDRKKVKFGLLLGCDLEGEGVRKGA